MTTRLKLPFGHLGVTGVVNWSFFQPRISFDPTIIWPYRFFAVERIEPLLSVVLSECLEGEGGGFVLRRHVEAPSLLDRIGWTPRAIRHHERLRRDPSRLA